MNELDRIRLERAKDMPELIREVGDWEVVACCAVCKGHINTSDGLLYRIVRNPATQFDQHGRRLENVKISCPHCTAVRRVEEEVVEVPSSGRNKTKKKRVIVYHPLPHTLKRVRLIVTEREVGTRVSGMLWWREKRQYVISQSGVWEEEILGDVPPGEGGADERV